MINKNNYYTNTIAHFKKCVKPSRKADYVSYKKFRVYSDELDQMEYYGVTEVIEDYLEFEENEDGSKYAVDGYLLCTNGEVSSTYWYTKNGVIRESAHWCDVATCKWTFEEYEENQTLIGYCLFADFEKLEDYNNRIIKEKEKKEKLRKIDIINKERKQNQYIIANKHLVLLLEFDIKYNHKMTTFNYLSLCEKLSETNSIVKKAKIIRNFNSRTYKCTQEIHSAFHEMLMDSSK